MSAEGARKEEILATAANLFASSGLQTSLKDIADSCGILPGSLYHHFDSKEALIVELVRRYRDDLDRVAKAAVGHLDEFAAEPAEQRIMAFGRAISDCGVRNRAALLLTLYEPPTVLGDELGQLARQMPAEIEASMVEILRQGRQTGEIRPGVDLALLADRLCQSMLHVGVGVSHLTPGASHAPELRLRILLHGVATETPSNAELDRSAAMKAARDVIATWSVGHEGSDRINHLRAVARKEFGRRGYESTTMRDIAAAARLSTGTVYRCFASKDELLLSIMTDYYENWTSAWEAVLRSEGGPAEKVDALMWVNVNVIERFSDEFTVQLAWLRQSPPTSPNLDFSFRTQLKQIRSLLTAGSKQGDLVVEGPSADVRARCLFEAVMSTPNIVRAAGPRAAHRLGRDTVLRGAGVRSRSGARG